MWFAMIQKHDKKNESFPISKHPAIHYFLYQLAESCNYNNYKPVSDNKTCEGNHFGRATSLKTL